MLISSTKTTNRSSPFEVTIVSFDPFPIRLIESGTVFYWISPKVAAAVKFLIETHQLIVFIMIEFRTV